MPSIAVRNPIQIHLAADEKQNLAQKYLLVRRCVGWGEGGGEGEMERRVEEGRDGGRVGLRQADTSTASFWRLSRYTRVCIVCRVCAT